MRTVRLHVICGGGTGALLLRKLAELGYRVSAGPLSRLDDDAKTAEALGMDVALLPEAGASRADPLSEVRRWLGEADGVILTPFAVGRGNLVSLTLATELPPQTPLFLIAGGVVVHRDYTGGEATRLHDQLRTRAAAAPRSLHELLPLLAERFPPG